MSNTQNAVTVVTETLSFGQRLARWIDDPFSSVIVGIVTPAVASTLVLSSIWALAVVS
jgi:hypothetical protein